MPMNMNIFVAIQNIYRLITTILRYREKYQHKFRVDMLIDFIQLLTSYIVAVIAVIPIVIVIMAMRHSLGGAW